MEQCRADSCIYRKIGELVLVVHEDGILVSGMKEACDELHHTPNKMFPSENLRELNWYLGRIVERD